jgi:hypothetical protein
MLLCVLNLPLLFRFLAVLASHGEGTRSQLSERELKEALAESADFIKQATVEKELVIVKSTPKYKEARRAAAMAAERLHLPLNLRDLAPHRKEGLTFSKKECEDSAFDYPCYVARGRDDDGEYVSVEYSTAYSGFVPGLYIVVIATDTKGSATTKEAVRAAKAVFKDAYIRTTGIYMGCMH